MSDDEMRLIYTMVDRGKVRVLYGDDRRGVYIIRPYVELRDWILGKRSDDELISRYGLGDGDEKVGN